MEVLASSSRAIVVTAVSPAFITMSTISSVRLGGGGQTGEQRHISRLFVAQYCGVFGVGGDALLPMISISRRSARLRHAVAVTRTSGDSALGTISSREAGVQVAQSGKVGGQGGQQL